MTNTRVHGSHLQDSVTKKISNGRDHKIWDCESPLYDSYELVTFAHIIERKLMPLIWDECGDLSPRSGLSLRALMDKEKDDYPSGSKTMRSIQRRKYWWNRNKNVEKKVEIKKKKMFDCIFVWNSLYNSLIV